MAAANRKEDRALAALLQLIAQGVEYPDAEWKASNEGKLVDCSRLRELYDEACAKPAQPRDYLLPGV